MPTHWEVPFNVLGWSLAVFILFAMLQILTVTAFTLAGSPVSPYVGLFTWAAVSSAITYGLISRYRASLRHLLIVQGFACFYMLATSAAVNLRARGGLAQIDWLQVAVTIAGLFLCGVIGIAFARMMKERLDR